MITISISSFNQQQYLPQAIESALNQTVSCEILVIDDGSTDNSLEIARKYPVKVISQVNKGLSSARNTGLMNATGDIFLPLDADDILLPNCAQNIKDVFVRKLYENKQVDVVGLSFKEFGIRNTEIILMPNPTFEDFKTGNRLGYCSAIRTSVLKEVGGYSPRMTWGWEDLHLWINLLSKGKTIVTIPEVLWLYRTKENSMYTESIKHSEELTNQLKKDFPNFYETN